jgi:hypothetical protein
MINNHWLGTGSGCYLTRPRHREAYLELLAPWRSKGARAHPSTQRFTDVRRHPAPSGSLLACRHAVPASGAAMISSGFARPFHSHVSTVVAGCNGFARAQPALHSQRVMRQPTVSYGLAPGIARWDGGEMDLAAQFEALQKRVSEAASTVRAAASESRDQLKQRIDQAQVDADLARKDAQQQAGQAADRAQGKWAEMKADAAAKMEDVKAKIDKRGDQLNFEAAAVDASRTAADASDAIDLANWAVENARLTALDALDSQAYAEELEKKAHQ